MSLITRNIIYKVIDLLNMPEALVVLKIYAVLTKRRINYFTLTPSGKIENYKKTNNTRNIKYWLHMGKNDSICKYAGRTDNKELLDYCDFSLDQYFYGAAKGGQVKLINKLLPRVFSEGGESILALGLSGAGFGGHEHIAEICILYGNLNNSNLSFGFGRSGAIHSNLEKRFNMDPVDIIVGACYGGHLNVVANLFRTKKFKNREIYKATMHGFYFACFKNHTNIIDYFIKKHKFDWFNKKILIKNGLNGAIKGGHVELEKKLKML